jgi:hypothetical protein
MMGLPAEFSESLTARVEGPARSRAQVCILHVRFHPPVSTFTYTFEARSSSQMVYKNSVRTSQEGECVSAAVTG